MPEYIVNLRVSCHIFWFKLALSCTFPEKNLEVNFFPCQKSADKDSKVMFDSCFCVFCAVCGLFCSDNRTI